MVVADALGEILVRGADDDSLDGRVGGPAVGGRGNRIVGLELDHRPQDEAQRLDGALGDRELVEQLGRHADARLVAGKQVVAKRLDDTVRRARDVRGAFFAEQEQQLLDEAGYAREDDPVAARHRRTRCVMRAEELVGRVDEVELHAHRTAADSITTPAESSSAIARSPSPGCMSTGRTASRSRTAANPSRTASSAVARTQ